MDLKTLITLLKAKGIRFEDGLTIQEIEWAEGFYDLVFPPDIKAFLGMVLPVSESFVNWRDRSETNIKIIRESLNWPLDGMLFDVEHNGFWHEGWGAKPERLEKAIEICRKEIEQVPKLIPVFAHRYIPSEPDEAGNPVLSVYQTDIICYGEDLLSYLQVEFNLKKYEDINFDSLKIIRFWSSFLE